MSLTIKKFILISHIDKHQIKHIFTPAIFHKGIRLYLYLLGIFTKKILVSAKGTHLQDVLRSSVIW